MQPLNEHKCLWTCVECSSSLPATPNLGLCDEPLVARHRKPPYIISTYLPYLPIQSNYGYYSSESRAEFYPIPSNLNLLTGDEGDWVGDLTCKTHSPTTELWVFPLKFKQAWAAGRSFRNSISMLALVTFTKQHGKGILHFLIKVCCYFASSKAEQVLGFIWFWGLADGAPCSLYLTMIWW